MAKYTDEQIKKALECCIKAPYCSEKTDCPYKGIDDCVKKHTLDALDLINRQEAEKEALIAGQETLQKYLAEKEAEIERLQTEADRYKRYYFNHEYDKLIAEAKSEAIKECTKKLKSIFGEWIFSYKTEDLFKELEGEGE